MPELIPALPHLLMLGQHAVHRSLGAELSGIEQRGVHLWGEIREARLVQHGKDGGAFSGAERARQGAPARRCAADPGPTGVTVAITISRW